MKKLIKIAVLCASFAIANVSKASAQTVSKDDIVTNYSAVIVTTWTGIKSECSVDFFRENISPEEESYYNKMLSTFSNKEASNILGDERIIAKRLTEGLSQADKCQFYLGIMRNLRISLSLMTGSK